MNTSRNLIIAGLAGCALLLVIPASATFDLLGLQPAFAKNGGGNGNGGGHSANAHSSSQGAGPGNSASAPGHNKSSATPRLANTNAPTPAPTKGPRAKGLDARIARLHAVNANLQAFLHANLQSTVGKLKVYAMAVVDTEEAAAARDIAEGTFNTASMALGDAKDAYDASVMVLTDTYGFGDTSTDALQAQKGAILTTDTSGFEPEELQTYNDEIAAIDQALADAAALNEAQTAYDAADRAFMEADKALADAEMATSDALNAAANRNRVPVDEDVKTYVDTELEAGGVLDYFRAMGEDGGVIVE